MATGLPRELNSLIGKRILVKLSQDFARFGTLVHVFDDHIQIRPEDEVNILLIPFTNILYVQEA